MQQGIHRKIVQICCTKCKAVQFSASRCMSWDIGNSVAEYFMHWNWFGATRSFAHGYVGYVEGHFCNNLVSWFQCRNKWGVARHRESHIRYWQIQLQTILCTGTDSGPQSLTRKYKTKKRFFAKNILSTWLCWVLVFLLLNFRREGSDELFHKTESSFCSGFSLSKLNLSRARSDELFQWTERSFHYLFSF